MNYVPYLATAVDVAMAPPRGFAATEAEGAGEPVLRVLRLRGAECPAFVDWLAMWLPGLAGAHLLHAAPALVANDQRHNILLMHCAGADRAIAWLQHLGSANCAVPLVVAVESATMRDRVALYNAGADAVLDLSWEPELAAARIWSLWDREQHLVAARRSEPASILSSIGDRGVTIGDAAGR